MNNRLKVLIVKEFRQMFRDSSNIVIGIVMPVALIIIFGYGLSLDIKNAPVAVVQESYGDKSVKLAAAIGGSPFFNASYVKSVQAAQQLLVDNKVDAIVVIPQDMENKPDAQIIVNALDANYGRLLTNYLRGVITDQMVLFQAESDTEMIRVNTRPWFNDRMESNYSLIPGLIVTIMTLIGAMLTALVMSREWERGTLESLFVTPVRASEIIVGKIIPYFCLGMVGFVICLVAAKFMFGLPIVGSALLLTFCSMLYLFVSLGFGLVVSSKVKSQFLASQIVLVAGFLPSLLLSGFLFDMSTAPLVVMLVGKALPATWYVELIQTVMLVGNVTWIVLKNCIILIIYIVVFMRIAVISTKKSLE